ncbi:hypothetical protein ACIQUB_07275 [Rhizobium sp. NPDC090275]|uniref:hypothetical protein n=1 Tax=Rhizobium sp. NPDC090275 TaxID=3364498 RepID=UPI00383AA589
MKRVVGLSVLCVLAGCVSAPQGYWHRVSDGKRVDADQVLLAQFQRDRAVCDGEAAKASLASNEKVLSVHNYNVNLVFDGCLVGKGYVRQPT